MPDRDGVPVLEFTGRIAGGNWMPGSPVSTVAAAGPSVWWHSRWRATVSSIAAAVDLPVVFPVNAKVTVHCWTR